MSVAVQTSYFYEIVRFFTFVNKSKFGVRSG